MSQQYDNTNRGIISKNKRKESDRHPDIKGSINIEGVEYWLDGWQKTGSQGPFYSLSAKRKEARQDAPAASTSASYANLDDDIPFAPEWR